MRDAEASIKQVLHYALGNGFCFFGIKWSRWVVVSAAADCLSDERIDLVCITQ